MSKALIAACFAVSLISVAVASGSAVPVLYGVGEATTGVTATTVISSLIGLLSGGSGLWALLRQHAPSVLGVLRPVIGGTSNRIDDAALTVVEALFGSRLDASTLTEEGAILFVVFMRAKAGDSEGKDQAFALLEHVRKAQPKVVTTK